MLGRKGAWQQSVAEGSGLRRSAVAGSGKLRTAAVGGDQLRLQQLTVAAQRLAELGNDWQGLAANVDSWQRSPCHRLAAVGCGLERSQCLGRRRVGGELAGSFGELRQGTLWILDTLAWARQSSAALGLAGLGSAVLRCG